MLRCLAIFDPADEGIHQPGWARTRAYESMVNARHEKQPGELHRLSGSAHLLLNLPVIVYGALRGNELIGQAVIENQLAAAVTKVGEIRIITSEDRAELLDRLIEEQFIFSIRQGRPVPVRILDQKIMEVLEGDIDWLPY